MSSDDSALVTTDSASLAALAEELRDGPLQRLVELQRQTTELAERLTDSTTDRIEDIERLVRLSLAAMEHFHVFTREFAAVLRELTEAERRAH